VKRTSIIFLVACVFAFKAYAQHPDKFKYNLERKEYSMSGEEKKAVISAIKDWFAKHDTLGTDLKISAVRFGADEVTLIECDSIATKILYDKATFKGFPHDIGSFFDANIVVKTKTGEEHYTVAVSYYYEVIKVFNPLKVVYAASGYYKFHSH
jgi:hypothetical protein